jgi:cytochrome c peroxidase
MGRESEFPILNQKQAGRFVSKRRRERGGWGPVNRVQQFPSASQGHAIFFDPGLSKDEQFPRIATRKADATI